MRIISDELGTEDHREEDGQVIAEALVAVKAGSRLRVAAGPFTVGAERNRASARAPRATSWNAPSAPVGRRRVGMARPSAGSVIPPKDGRAWAIRFRAYGKRRFSPSAPPRRVGTVSAPRPSCGTSWRTSSAASGGRTSPSPSRLRPRFRPSTSSPAIGSRSTSTSGRSGRGSTTAGGSPTTCSRSSPTPALGNHIAEVDRYKAATLAAGKLSPSTVNKTLVLLSAILETAEERELIARNTARGKRRRLRVRQPKRTYLDTATQIGALLEAAGELDAEAQEHPQPEKRLVPRRATLATLALGGLRIGELCELRWRDVDLAAGRLRVGDAKTDAGRRDVRLLATLRDELATLKARAADPGPEGYVFATARGGRPRPRTCGAHPRQSGRACQRGAQRGRRAAAAGRAHAARPAAHLRKRPVRARRVAGRGHGAARPHSPRPSAAHLRARNATRRRREGTVYGRS